MKKINNKINKILIIAIIILVIMTILAIVIAVATSKNKKIDPTYNDKVECNNKFETIAINLKLQRVKRDGTDTDLKTEFGVSAEEEKILLSSKENLQNFFSDSSFDVSEKDNIMYIKNEYQTKKIMLITNNIEIQHKNSFNAKAMSELSCGVYVLEYDTKNKAKEAYNYFFGRDGITVIKDEVFQAKQINDESQTMYGGEEANIAEGTNSKGITDMGLDKFKNVINENGNASEVVVSTIGWGILTDNEFFDNRISDNYYNFISDKKDASETISQGSRIASVIVDSTPSNVKLLPIKIVDENGCTCISAILNAIEYGAKNSDVICYELVNKQNKAIDQALKYAYSQDKAFCAVTPSGDISYPANHATTIATSSLDKSFKLATYSGNGAYLDFATPSTDIKEIFNTASGVSRWSGAQYSNAYIASIVALLKTYNKQYSIKEVYNEIIRFCKDLDKQGKDDMYGYGMPDFTQIKISDLDKVAPTMKDIAVNNEVWEKVKNITISATDNIKMSGWQISNSQDAPTEWNNVEGTSPNLETSTEIKENGTYFVWVKDSADNASYKQIEVSKVDSKSPDITYSINRDTLATAGYMTITATATDNESGLAEAPYSWDNVSWGKENNTLRVTANGVYKVYCKDNVGNVAEKEIEINNFEIEGRAVLGEGQIIKNIIPTTKWNGNTNLDVQVIFNNNIDIIGWQITEENVKPNNFVIVKSVQTENTHKNANSTNSTNQNSIQQNNILNVSRNVIENTSVNTGLYNTKNTYVAIGSSFEANKQYYAWVEDVNGNVYSQGFKVVKGDGSN